MLFPLQIKINVFLRMLKVQVRKYFDNSVKVVKCLDVATFSHSFKYSKLNIRLMCRFFICRIFVTFVSQKAFLALSNIDTDSLISTYFRQNECGLAFLAFRWSVIHKTPFLHIITTLCVWLLSNILTKLTIICKIIFQVIWRWTVVCFTHNTLWHQ
jgi:hypothetical protein